MVPTILLIKEIIKLLPRHTGMVIIISFHKGDLCAAESLFGPEKDSLIIHKYSRWCIKSTISDKTSYLLETVDSL
jgi:hypothetical protein